MNDVIRSNANGGKKTGMVNPLKVLVREQIIRGNFFDIFLKSYIDKKIFLDS